MLVGLPDFRLVRLVPGHGVLVLKGTDPAFVEGDRPRVGAGANASIFFRRE
jgi:hypothetical protein